MASDNSWEKAKQVLRETLEIDETRTVWLEGVRTQLQSLASTGISTMPDFTLHNEVHSDNIVLLIGELSKLLTSKLSPYETYLLATSSYLHDIGMFISAGRFNITMLPDLAKNLQVCPNNKCDGGVLYETELKKKTVDHQIRAVHHLISARMIAKDGVAQFHLSNLDIPHIVAICRGHRKADLRGQECDCYQTHPTKFGPVRRDLLAGLLRLADALDFYPDRAPLIDFRERAWDFLSNPVSLKHWLQHSFVNSVYLTHDDQGGNRALECQVSYAVPLDDDLNGQTYENFFQPLLDQLSDELQQGDFNGDKYPPILFESLGIRELKINLSLKPQLGVMGLPEVVVDNIRQSSCKNVLEFINYLEAKVSQEAPSEALVMDRRPEVQAFRTILEGDDPQHRLM